MKLGRLTKGGEVHALKREWWPLRLVALCHKGRGRKVVEMWDAGPEAITCQWCRVALGLERLVKRPPFVPPTAAPAAAARAYVPSILFPPVVDAEVVEGGAS